MTFNYRAGLFRIWLVLAILWVAIAAWAQLPLGTVIGVPLAACGRSRSQAEALLYRAASH